MKKSRRVLAILAALLLLIAFMAPATARAIHTGHTCAGGHCKICLELQARIALARGLFGAALILLAARRPFLRRFRLSGRAASRAISFLSPLELKVRLND